MLDVTRFAISPTGDRQVDDIIRGVVGIYEAVFPARVRGYYLTGSRADGSAAALSDIDLYVVFKGEFAGPEEEATARRLNNVLYTSRLSPIRLDVPARGERGLSPLDRLALKTASRFLYGEDIRDRLALPAIADYTRAVLHGAQRAIATVLRGVETLAFPLGYPDPDGEFYGYDRVRLPFWYPPGVERGLKELVLSTGRAATAIVARRCGRFVARKSESVGAYRACVADEWAPYLAALHGWGTARWGYLVPEAAGERALLRDLCRRTLAFENHFLALYRDYLLAQLGRADPAGRLFAAQRLGEVLYPDEEIGRALRELGRGDDAELRHVVRATLRRIEQARANGAPPRADDHLG
jgi:predicted nucleotidyltransferase